MTELTEIIDFLRPIKMKISRQIIQSNGDWYDEKDPIHKLLRIETLLRDFINSLEKEVESE